MMPALFVGTMLASAFMAPTAASAAPMGLGGTNGDSGFGGGDFGGGGFGGGSSFGGGGDFGGGDF